MHHNTSRHRLRQAALALPNGAAPPGLATSDHRVRSATFVLPVGTAFEEAKREDLKVRDGIPQTSI